MIKWLQKPEILRYKKTTKLFLLVLTLLVLSNEPSFGEKRLKTWLFCRTYYIDYESKYTWNRNLLQQSTASATSYVHYSMEVVLDNSISAKN